jgi:chaperonin GroES
MDEYTTEDQQEPMDESQPVEQAEQLSAGQKLAVIMQHPNIAEVLPEEKLAQISLQVMEEYQIDKTSRLKWEERMGDAMDLAMMVSEEKEYPFSKAANIKYPLLTVAALQFNARAYPAIVQGNKVAKCMTWGRDPNGEKQKRADRVSEHLSYQLLSELPEWEEDTDKLLVILPIVGSAFRKVWHDPVLKRNRTRLVSSANLVVNYFARSMMDVPRVTEEMRLYPYEISERIRGKRFIEFDYSGGASSEPIDVESTRESENKADPADKDAPHLFLEQHRLLDLDEDDYPEPYVVTVHHATGKVCRIVANFNEESVTMADDGSISAIRRSEYYVKYQFLPSPDGGFYGWGFGWLLKDLGESINSTLNMMMDAGHLANMQGGLVSASLGIKEKKIRLQPGEWRVIDTRGKIGDGIMPINYPGPSDVLFKLLGLLIEAGKEVAAIKDVLTGDTPATAPVGTTLAIIEQGLQVFTSIYKRIHRALKVELGLHAKLNTKLDPQRYNAFFDDQQQFDPAQDYSEADMDILPVSDPNSVTKQQRLGKAQLIKDIAAENPTIDQAAATRRVLEAADIDDIDELMAKPPQPNPEEEILKRVVAMLAVEGQRTEILEKRTKALKNIADAEAAEEGTQIAAYSQYLQAMADILGSQGQQDGPGRLSGMEGQPGNGGGVPALPQGSGPDGGIPQGPLVEGNAIGPDPMGGSPASSGL